MNILQCRLGRVAAAAAAISMAGIGVNSARAAMVTYNYEGVVSALTADDTGQFAAAGIAPGTTFFGEFKYDPLEPSVSVFTGGANYPPISLNIEFDVVAGTKAAATAGNIQVYNGHSFFQDGFNLVGNPLTSAQLTYDNVFFGQVFLIDNDATIFSSVALPPSLPLLSEFEQRQFFYHGSNLNGDTDRFTGTITSLTLNPVPLPAALPLFLSALAGLAFIGRRRRQADA